MSVSPREAVLMENNVQDDPPASRWDMGILQAETEEVPGSVLLLSVGTKNAPLGIHHNPSRRSASSLPSQDAGLAQSHRRRQRSPGEDVKKSRDGKIILDPQPEDSANDPLNWASWRRDLALISIGLYCMVGGGMTPVLAAGFPNVAATFDVSQASVALTTGLYMLGLGLGSVVWSPTAILFGKRPVYLFTCVLYALSAIWCALSPSFASLIVARIFQGISVAPVECLPSASIAEIFFLHERAYRLGIYTLLLLGGKNLSPLASAAIIQRLGWEWVFYIIAMIVAFCGLLLFFFVPETFWDRTPRAHETHGNALKTALKKYSSSHGVVKEPERRKFSLEGPREPERVILDSDQSAVGGGVQADGSQRRAHFDAIKTEEGDRPSTCCVPPIETTTTPQTPRTAQQMPIEPGASSLHNRASESFHSAGALEMHQAAGANDSEGSIKSYTEHWRRAPAKTYLRTLRPWDGRFRNDNWFKVALRPFVLFAYPAILWSAVVYSLSIGWLIVISESASEIYRSPDRYGFSALGVGLVYISPFIGGVLGTAVAGKLSDVIVRAMAHRNGGIYEPEFRLVMGIPIAICTSVGLMGYGWSAQNKDAWIVPTVFFGIISFGCSLGSTTSITFAVDSYRQYAGEALVTLNFSKNILHGLVFSLFFNKWLEADGAKTVFLALGGIQIFFMLSTPLFYVYGKRFRMWTVGANLMERF